MTDHAEGSRSKKERHALVACHRVGCALRWLVPNTWKLAVRVNDSLAQGSVLESPDGSAPPGRHFSLTHLSIFFTFTRQKATRPLVSTETMQRWHFVSPLFSFTADYMKGKKCPMDRTNLQVIEKMLRRAESVISTDSLNWQWMYVSLVLVSTPHLLLEHGKTTWNGKNLSRAVSVFGWMMMQIRVFLTGHAKNWP